MKEENRLESRSRFELLAPIVTDKSDRFVCCFPFALKKNQIDVKRAEGQVAILQRRYYGSMIANGVRERDDGGG